MNARRRMAAGTVLAALSVIARTSTAHPAGSASVNRYAGVSCSATGQIAIAYLLDFAELPAEAELEQLDADRDGVVSPDEQRAYLERRLPPLVAQWRVEVDGARAPLRVTGSSLEIVAGERGLSTLRIAAELSVEASTRGPLAAAGDLRVRVVDPVFADRPGWRQLAAEPSTDVTVVGGPTGSADGVLAYADPVAGEPRVDDAVFTFRARSPGDVGLVIEGRSTESPPRETSPHASRLSAMVRIGRANALPLATGLVLAVLAVAVRRRVRR